MEVQMVQDEPADGFDVGVARPQSASSSSSIPTVASFRRFQMDPNFVDKVDRALESAIVIEGFREWKYGDIARESIKHHTPESLREQCRREAEEDLYRLQNMTPTTVSFESNPLPGRPSGVKGKGASRNYRHTIPTRSKTKQRKHYKFLKLSNRRRRRKKKDQRSKADAKAKADTAHVNGGEGDQVNPTDTTCINNPCVADIPDPQAREAIANAADAESFRLSWLADPKGPGQGTGRAQLGPFKDFPLRRTVGARVPLPGVGYSYHIPGANSPPTPSSWYYIPPPTVSKEEVAPPPPQEPSSDSHPPPPPPPLINGHDLGVNLTKPPLDPRRLELTPPDEDEPPTRTKDAARNERLRRWMEDINDAPDVRMGELPSPPLVS
ncbi:MAG: hypothetical protein M1823_004768 [Watsoniomyces obsoletus]|nr:MAG: hypothetical protein M1823_004768 [Watsoniomyces obsoletus]